MSHYLALIEESDGNTAFGVWFPDVPGCFSAGDSFEEALHNAPEALSVHLVLLIEAGGELPRQRSLAEWRADPALAQELGTHIVAAIPLPPLAFRPAAE
ncbi:type II toxin-antitoxin system HicB family antitoxin [Rhabdaerophilum calidifontis]|uniref:type II toxin-antitoxin system HicB family antitoxin n=1 Tax=Rhabdaerophilum calidifontis TaxID=2604328 RepID=UPI00123AC6F5|nr:type II toxin-antitoxin system HicB family antitoxin [Rhabdaerophilum calidifontis]